MSEKKPYYISTAIAYTSAKPHIGNTYEIVLADAIARYKRAQGYDVYFQTGTDEHGLKIQQKAEAAGITPQEYVDNVAGQIKDIWDLMNTTYDRFVRTTDPSTSPRCRRFSAGCTKRVISTRASTRASTAPPASPSGPKASSKTASAPTAAGSAWMLRKKPTSLR